MKDAIVVLAGGIHEDGSLAPSDLDPAERKARAEQEGKTIQFLDSWFKKMGNYTDEKLREWLFEKHPGYAQSRGITKEEMLRNLGRVE